MALNFNSQKENLMVERQAKMQYERFMRKVYNIDSRLKAARKGMDTDAFNNNNLEKVKGNIVRAIDRYTQKNILKRKGTTEEIDQIDFIKHKIYSSDDLLNEVAEYLEEFINKFVRL